jgi:ADP-ribose pyrophosphatase YjhB (NUDIX family)|tara:strand:- start:107 stop:649 length:543 start_codon:yes stop_codon:yes gene_type:complete
MNDISKLFCTQCGNQSLTKLKPQNDTHLRIVCKSCNNIIYDNPKIVVGSVCSFENKILLCKRAIDPQKGLWTLPAGYLEVNESAEEGAIREAYEEAYANIKIINLLAVYSLKHISQIQMIFESELIDKNIKPGIESLDVGLFSWSDIPWEKLAFESVKWSLNNFKQRQNSNTFKVFNNPN